MQNPIKPTSKSMPRIGFGTFNRQGEKGIAAILCALETGYRHLDTAQTYETEWEVGEALRQSNLPREDVFLTTKVSTDYFAPGQLVPSLKRSLDQLGIAQLNLALIHWPAPNNTLPLPVYFDQLLTAQQQGLTQEIGVSNFTIQHLQEAQQLAGDQLIFTNQIELNPCFQNRKVADFCQKQGILVTCYQPIAQGNLVNNSVLSNIAAAHNASVEQIALAFELAKGYAVIPTSSNPEHIRTNWKAQTLTLTQEEINTIENIEQGQRSIDPAWGPEWD